MKKSNSLFFVALLLVPFLSSSAEGTLAGAKPSTLAFNADSLGCVTNPAGSHTVGDRADFAVRWENLYRIGIVRGNATPAFNGRFNGSPRNTHYDYGFNKNFKMKVCSKCLDWSLSFAHYTVYLGRTSYREPIPLFGTSRLSITSFREAYVGALSLKVTDKHSVGVALLYHLYHGKYSGLQSFDFPGVTVSVGHVTNRGWDHMEHVGVLVGWRWQISDKLTFGATYTPLTDMGRLHKYRGLFPRRGKNSQIAIAGAGITYLLTPKIVLAFDLNWLDFKSVQLGHRLLNSEGNVNPLGSKDGPLTGQRNNFVYSVGGAYFLNECMTVKAGWIHSRGSVPRTETLIGLATCEALKNIVAVGATYLFQKHHEFSLLYSHGFKRKLKGHNSIPASLGGGEADNIERLDSLAIGYGYKI